MRFARFVGVGALNTLFGYGLIFAAMYGFGWGPEVSNAFGYGVGFLLSFHLHRELTFRSGGGVGGELLRYVLVFAFSYGVNLLALTGLVRGMGVPAFVAQLLAGVVYVLVSYGCNAALVFRAPRTGDGER